MENLKYAICYLIGGIDRQPDNGAGWRERVKKDFADFGMCFIDPLNKPVNIGLEDDDARDRRKLLKSIGEYDEFSRLMKEIRTIDLLFTDKADMAICYIDVEYHMCGTYEEITSLNRSKRPILIVCKQGKQNVPDWLFGMLPHQFFFDDFSQLRSYLTFVNEAVKPLHKRWKFLNAKHLYPELIKNATS